VLVAAVGVAATGDRQAKVMTQVQPMKMAAAEALYDTKSTAGFSIFTIGTLEGRDEIFSVRIPGLLSYLGKGDFDARIEGINDIQTAYEAKYGPGNYTPNIPLTYWTFRLMIGVGLSAALAAIWVLWAFKRGRLPKSRWWGRVALLLPLTPLLGNSFGWIFTEMGRQPWIVFGLMPTSAGVSPNVSTAEVLTSLIGFTLVYGFLAVVEVRLLLKTISAGLPEIPVADEHDDTDDEQRQLAFAY
jgi:cytochrome d ubiquinol oxidase subunit I